MPQVHHQPGSWIDGRSGEAIPHGEMVRRMAAKRAVLLGETHDRFDIHRWQLHVTAALHACHGNIVVGFEMFPRRVQPALDAWVAGNLDTDAFLEQADWQTVWGFPAELYLPTFHYCQQFRVPMKALNCRRPLVTEVGKLGWDAIPPEERDGVTPAKTATPAYRQFLFDITGGGRPDRKATSAQDPQFDRFVRAQQTWDRAFACGIADALSADPEALVIGIIGRGHLEYGHSTPYQLEDLGIEDVGILLPEDEAAFDLDRRSGIADGLFRLDTMERAARTKDLQRTAAVEASPAA